MVPDTYAALKQAIEHQFAVINQQNNARDRLKVLRQTKSVYQYMHTFEGVALQIENAQDSELLHAFVWGLKDKVRQEVRLCDPKML